MGSCLSNQITAESPFHAGANSSKIVSGYGTDSSNKSLKTNPSSVPPTPRTESEILQSPNLKIFAFSELKSATRNIRPDIVLGEGGFGSVFKGWIDKNTLAASRLDSNMVVAVKRLNQEGLQGHREWLAEINYLGQIRHPNLVKLIGYCLEDDQKLLVYEFMPKGSMENHLFRRGSYFQPLSWSLRMKIALGAARGLVYLHSDEFKVIYRDFKTSNILLDSNCNPKLSDFGLTRDSPTDDKRHVSTRVMGTYGYAAPEYLSTAHLTAKSDVYSFGVVLLEILSTSEGFSGFWTFVWKDNTLLVKLLRLQILPSDACLRMLDRGLIWKRLWRIWSSFKNRKMRLRKPIGARIIRGKNMRGRTVKKHEERLLILGLRLLRFRWRGRRNNGVHSVHF